MMLRRTSKIVLGAITTTLRPAIGIAGMKRPQRLFSFDRQTWLLFNKNDKNEKEDEEDKKEQTFKEQAREFFSNPKIRKSILLTLGVMFAGLYSSQNIHDIFGVELGLYKTIGVKVVQCLTIGT